MWSPDELRRRRDALISEDGPWTAADLDLGGGLRTMEHERRDDDERIAFVVQALSDVLGPARGGARVLDLACLEGSFSIELARQGFSVVGVDARAENLRKARFAAEALALEHARFVEGDVRHLDPAALGRFDAILCLGILQHVDGAHVPALVSAIGALCTRVAVFDTHVGLWPSASVAHEGMVYRGGLYQERQGGESADHQRARTWAALDNPTSFWPTKRSLLRMIAAAGFTTIFEGVSPPVSSALDRVRLVAIKGQPVTLASVPTPAPAVERLDDLGRKDLDRLIGSLRVRVVPRLPGWTRELLQRARGR